MRCADHRTDAERLPYCAWHEKSDESAAAGQTRCEECKRYFWPWEEVAQPAGVAP